jgi:hypothetical protein
MSIDRLGLSRCWMRCCLMATRKYDVRACQYVGEVVWANPRLVGIAKDEPLLERLRILVSESTTDAHIKRKAVELFNSWSVNFRDQPGMEQIAKLRSQLPAKVLVAYI